ncbi:MAG: FecR domain-containing protein [Deltaproteobacteria bacterium]|nr:FecR domain-containing protein [Deltaproteobacteria bacterium]
MKRPGKEILEPLNLGDTLSPGDLISTGVGARAQIFFKDGAFLNLSENARLMISLYIYAKEPSGRKLGIRLYAGSLRVVAATRTVGTSSILVETDYASIRTSFSDFIVSEDDASTEVYVFKNALLLRNLSAIATDKVQLKSGYWSRVDDKKEPLKSKVITSKSRRQLLASTNL